jgi:autotransporter-associated beta strand protein
VRDGIVPSATGTGTTTLYVGGSAGGDMIFYGGPRTFEAASGTGTVTVEGLRDNGSQKLAVTKHGANTVTLESRHIYTGPTEINDGQLFVEGTIAGGSVDVIGGRLSGTGAILVPVIIHAGGTLAPGDGLGTLSLSNTLTFAAGGMAQMDLNADTLSHDRVQGITSVTYGGTLVVSNLAGVFSPGQSFPLFSAASADGEFEQIIPPPGADLAWQFEPASGILSVIALEVTPPAITQFSLESDGGFTLLGTGPGNQSYRVFTTTNLASPFAEWMEVATGSFLDGTFSFTDAQASNHVQRFYRVVTP